MKILTCTLVSIGLHLAIGWYFSLLGPMLAGGWAIKNGWRAGLVTLLLAWSILLAWNFAVASYEAWGYARILGSLLGNLPAGLGVALTLLTSAVLGASAGFVGQSIAQLISRNR